MKKKIIAITLVVLLMVSSISLASSGFSDVRPNHWHYKYVMKIVEMGIIDGFSDGTFKPNSNLTRAQMAKIIVEYDKKINEEVTIAIQESSSDEQAVVNAVANSIPSTVRVDTVDGFGSGFFVKSNLIMTNSHVVGEYEKVKITTSTGEVVVGKVVASDKGKDIAIVKVEKDFNHLTFSTKLRVGQNAIAIGNPLGQDMTVTKGIVSKLDIAKYKESVMFQMDTPINSGNSGGAVINTNGEVIGMVTGKLSGKGIEGMAFAIRAIDLMEFLNTYK